MEVNNYYIGDNLDNLKKVKDKSIDFIYFDPPYNSNIYSTILKIISDNRILNNNGLILVETKQLINIEKLNLEQVFSKKIGSSYLQCFKKLLNPFK